MQGFLIRELWAIGRRLGLFAVPEQRVQIRPNRYRVPDVCMVAEKPEGRGIVTRPPYLNFGVTWVWVIDPASRTGQVHGPNGVANIEDRVFSTDRFSVDLSIADL
jgi:Uma2 family endonuclease